MVTRRGEDERWFFEIDGYLRRLSAEGAARPRVAARKVWEPRVDLFEQDRHIVVRAEIPGVAGDEVNVTYLPERHSLLIAGVRREPAGERTGVHQLEILYGEFAREIVLPEVSVDAHGIAANAQDGMLVVTLPKRAPVRRKVVATVPR